MLNFELMKVPFNISHSTFIIAQPFVINYYGLFISSSVPDDFDNSKNPMSVRVIFCGVLNFPIHVSIRLLGSALDVTVGFDFFKNPMSVRVIFCLPLAKNCIENGITRT